MRVGRASHIAHHAGQIKLQHALVLRGFQRLSPQAGQLGVVFHQRHLLRLAAGELQVVDGLLVDVEHRRRGAVFRAHIGDGGAVANRQAVGAFAKELHIRANYALFAQKLSQRQHDVGGGDAGLALAGELDAHDIRQAHHRRMAQHHGFGFQAAHADGDHAQRVHVRGVAVSAHAGVREGHAVARLNHRGHFFQIDLVHDAVAGRDHVHILERGARPVDEVEAVFVAAVFNGAVFLEGFRVEAAALHGQRVVDDQLGGHHRVDQRRVAALVGDGVAQTGQIHQRGLAQDVMAHHTGRIPREIQIALALDQLLERIGQRGRVAAAHQLFGQHARGVGQGVVSTGGDGVHRSAGVVVVQRGAGQGLAECSVHDVTKSR